MPCRSRRRACWLNWRKSTQSRSRSIETRRLRLCSCRRSCQCREAIGWLGCKPIAGGQSLGPMLNFRLARTAALVDVSRAVDMRTARDDGDAIVYGAAVTHAEIEDGVVPDATPGWLAAIARGIAYRAVRNRGTIGGSLAHADPAADWVNVLTALGAEVILRRDDVSRTVALGDFFTGPFATVLEPDEVIASVRVLKRGPSAHWGYWKFCLKVGDFAKASAAVLRDPDRRETAFCSARSSVLRCCCPIRRQSSMAGYRSQARSDARRRICRMNRTLCMLRRCGERLRRQSAAERRRRDCRDAPRQWRQGHAHGRATHAFGRLRTRRPQSNRHASRLRARRLRCLHGDRRWAAGAFLPCLCRCLRR